nr:hypothetical protein [Candidatus Sigynarchaeota archaeon]
MIATFAVNMYVSAAGMLLDWGFDDSSSKYVPNIQKSYSGGNLNITIPVYVRNIGAIGFDVNNLSADFNLYNSSHDLVANTTNFNGSVNIPHGTTWNNSVAILQNMPIGIFTIINSTSVDLEILFHVSYAFSSTTLNLSFNFPGGLVI